MLHTAYWAVMLWVGIDLLMQVDTATGPALCGPLKTGSVVSHCEGFEPRYLCAFAWGFALCEVHKRRGIKASGSNK